MSTDLRTLFRRRDIDDEVVSLHDSLAKHHGGDQLGLREAGHRFTQRNDGDGFARGCHDNGFAKVVPSWVSVVEGSETRTLEGVLTKSKVTHTDFPLEPWHTYYDWNFFVHVDPQYEYLLSTNEEHDGDIIECEWDTAYLPQWAWPQRGDRVVIIGRWIYDCGHPKGGSHKTELHPPKTVVSFRREATQFAGNDGPTRATKAVTYIGREGGYWRQPINDQDYVFDLYLPPKPYDEAEPIWSIRSKTGRLPVQPEVSPFPTTHERALRIVVPLEGVQPHPDEYGVVVAGGWTDPRGTETAGIERVRVHVEKIFMDADFDTFGDEWYVYVGVNGRWRVWKSIGGSDEDLDYTVDLDVHEDDHIKLTACGFEADWMHDFIGDDSGYTWEEISRPKTSSERKEIELDLLRQLATTLNDENDRIGLFPEFGTAPHAATDRGSFTRSSERGDYRLRYRIEDR